MQYLAVILRKYSFDGSLSKQLKAGNLDKISLTHICSTIQKNIEISIKRITVGRGIKNGLIATENPKNAY